MSGWSAAATSARPRWPSSPPAIRPRPPERSYRSREAHRRRWVVTPTCATRPPAYRQQRIVYPLVSFVVARGGPAVTAWALVGWNLAAAAALGWLGAALARRRGRHALWGLAVAAYPGFVLSSPATSLTCWRRRCCLPGSSPS